MPDDLDLSELTAAVQRVQETYSSELLGQPKQSNEATPESGLAENHEEGRPPRNLEAILDAAVILPVASAMTEARYLYRKG